MTYQHTSHRFGPFLRLGICLAIATWVLPATCEAAEGVDFNRDIRPLLAKHCFVCHGPDEGTREADLRLDIADAENSGAYQVIEPGQHDASELITRITSDDPDTRMPPAKHGPPLDATAIAKISQWIDDGASYAKHWSFVPPAKSTVPEVQSPQWCESVVDRFVLKRIEQAGLQPSDPAARQDLIRRLYLDLTGLPPTPDAVDRFVNNDSPTAVRRLVDELLASPDYGPHMAAAWLDLARYADTNGYEKDRPRTMWPYRDWVIRALNQDEPYDQFSIKQLAGDMLSSPSEDELVATGFHRNTMLNEEGGIDPLEYRYYSMIDRVGTTGTIWMGLTVGCAQCHTHKYDPITHDDFYSIYALLNQADEPELALLDPATLERQRDLETQITKLEDELISRFFNTDNSEIENRDAVQADFQSWFATQLANASDWSIQQPIHMTATTPRLSVLDDGSILARGDTTKREVYELTFPATPPDEAYTAIRLEVLPHESLPAGGPGMAFYEGRRGDFFLSELSVVTGGQLIPLRDGSHSFGKISIGSGSADAAGVLDSDGSTGWSTATQENQANRLVVNFEKPFTSTEPWTIRLLFERHFAASLGHFRISTTTRTETPVVASIHDAATESELLNEARKGNAPSSEFLTNMQRRYLHISELLAKERKPIEKLQSQLPEMTQALVMQEREPDDYRKSYRHHRGEYLQPREEVEPGILDEFASHSGTGPINRLEFAKWLVSEANPLVGRVTVNRAWRQFFGEGIVRTSGDYGTQSEPPTHPKLLDWLAVDLADNDWSIKRLHRQIVLSATYQQQVAPPDAADPSNRLLAGHPYRRLKAEQIRDVFLTSSSTLSRRDGGPGVYPPQPTGVYELAYGGGKWPSSAGADGYRRSVYTFRKRTAPFAAFAVFDAPTGETCLARRDQSTTPLQSLTLLNDEMYIDLAQATADAALRDCGSDASKTEIVTRLFRRILSRPPTPSELTSVTHFSDELSSDSTANNHHWMLVARALMNLDEAITTP